MADFASASWRVGLLYILIGYLVIQTGRTEDLTGALEYLGKGSGRAVLIVIAAGLATYALWRLSDAAFGTEHGSGSWKALRGRAAAAGIGLVYLFMSYKAVRICSPAGPGRWMRSSRPMQCSTSRAVGPCSASRRCSWRARESRRSSKPGNARSCGHSTPKRCRSLLRWLGRIGYAARGVIFLCVAWLIGRAALNERSTEAGGMEQALDLLSGPLLYAVAFGLMLFGGISLVEARYRQIHRPPPAQAIEQKVADKLA